MSDIVNYEIKKISDYDIILNANENNLEMPQKLRKKINEALSKVELNRYPEDSSIKLRQAYAKYLGIDSEEIIVGHGSDEMLGLLIALNIIKGTKILTLDPDFSMYDYYVSMNEGEVVKYQSDEDGTVNVEKFIQLGLKLKPTLIMFSNPNNPTGKVISKKDVIKILEAFKDSTIICDEAYIDFCDCSMVEYINSYDNLIVTRTVSKAFGLAGIRIGFLIANKNKIDEIKKYKVPYNVNTLSQVVATCVIEEKDIIQDYIKTIMNERDRVYKQLKDIKLLTVYESESNFLYARSNNKDNILKALEDNSILIRDYVGKDTFRITIGTSYENDKVIEVLKSIR